jgi:glutathione synthase/RimK-type ligase-like ATP-grasp enzyme
MPETVFLQKSDLTPEGGTELLDKMASPLVLKAPNSSFSLYVERVSTPRDFVRVGKRFLRRADRVVVQQFVQSEFDWRVGVLANDNPTIAEGEEDQKAPRIYGRLIRYLTGEWG